jgi:hypothetical protein
MARKESVQARRQPLRRKTRRRVHAQDARPAVRDEVKPAADSVKRGAHVPQQHLAFGADMHAPTAPLEEHHAKVLLELADRVAHRAGRQVEFGGRVLE